jgi:hypothetical protein
MVHASRDHFLPYPGLTVDEDTHAGSRRAFDLRVEGDHARISYDVLVAAVALGARSSDDGLNRAKNDPVARPDGRRFTAEWSQMLGFAGRSLRVDSLNVSSVRASEILELHGIAKVERRVSSRDRRIVEPDGVV